MDHCEHLLPHLFVYEVLISLLNVINNQAAMESFTKEREARIAAERLQTTLSEELGRAQRESTTTNQKVIYYITYIHVCILYTFD